VVFIGSARATAVFRLKQITLEPISKSNYLIVRFLRGGDGFFRAVDFEIASTDSLSYIAGMFRKRN